MRITHNHKLYQVGETVRILASGNSAKITSYKGVENHEHYYFLEGVKSAISQKEIAKINIPKKVLQN